jgi:hypothetical protein
MLMMWFQTFFFFLYYWCHWFFAFICSLVGPTFGEDSEVDWFWEVQLTVKGVLIVITRSYHVRLHTCVATIYYQLELATCISFFLYFCLCLFEFWWSEKLILTKINFKLKWFMFGYIYVKVSWTKNLSAKIKSRIRSYDL